jgi:hypothetical protein
MDLDSLDWRIAIDPLRAGILAMPAISNPQLCHRIENNNDQGSVVIKPDMQTRWIRAVFCCNTVVLLE